MATPAYPTLPRPERAEHLTATESAERTLRDFPRTMAELAR